MTYLVYEHEEDKLADGSDDERRLYRAELQAGKKAKAWKAAKRKSNSLRGKVGRESQDGSPRVLLFPMQLYPSRPPPVQLNALMLESHKRCLVHISSVGYFAI